MDWQTLLTQFGLPTVEILAMGLVCWRVLVFAGERIKHAEEALLPVLAKIAEAFADRLRDK